MQWQEHQCLRHSDLMAGYSGRDLKSRAHGRARGRELVVEAFDEMRPAGTELKREVMEGPS